MTNSNGRSNPAPSLLNPHSPNSKLRNPLGRLDLFAHFIVLTRFTGSQVAGRYIANPDDLTTTMTGLNLGSGLLPAGCLFWSRLQGCDRLGIYIPPKIWLVKVQGEQHAWRVPLPGLVFVGYDHDYRLWAVTERPASRNVPLYQAPCPYVNNQGGCHSDTLLPLAGVTTIWQAADLFFTNRFGRGLVENKSRAYPNCVLDQWRTLTENGIETYPAEDLIQTNLTIGRIAHG